jgi:hypothetical protein
MLHPSDSFLEKAAKVGTRAVLGVATVGISEAVIAGRKSERAERAQLQELYDRLDEAVGSLTYDQAISHWGPPAAAAEGRQIIVATWDAESTTQVIREIPMEPFWTTRPVTHGWELRLTFSKETGKLTEWDYREW